MSGSQLPLFQRKTYKGIIPTIPLEIQAPEAHKTVLQTLPAYYTYLQSGGFSQYTPDDFTGDLKKFGLFEKGKLVKEINTKNIQAWISFLKTSQPKGEGLSAKTVSRKLTALGNYFQWLVVNEVIVQQANPMLGIANFRISSPLPEIGSSTVKRGHEHHRSMRRFSVREGRPRGVGGVQRGGGT